MTNQRRGVRSLLSAGGLAATLTLSAVACSDGGAANTAASSAPTADAKQALTALDAGLKAHAAGDLVKATAEYNRTLSFDRTNKFAFYNLALIDTANGNYGLAEAKYRAALKTDPKYQPALFNLAILRTRPNDNKEAIALYKRAVAADKTDAAAWLNLGLLQRTNGERAAGNKNVLRAIALNPKLKDPAKAAGSGGVQSPTPKRTP